MIKKILAAIALGILPAAAAFAQIVPVPNGSNDGNSYNGPLVNVPGGLAFSNTYALDLGKYDASKVSAQVLLSSVNYTSPTFSDGSESTASVRVISVTGLSSATATDQITVTTNAFASNPTITVQNCVLTMGQQFNKGATAQATASNLATAIHACVPAINTSASGGIVYATATYGSYANAYAFVSNSSSMTVASPTMTGGADNACLTIAGTALCNNGAWTAGASTTTAVLSLGNAIANASLYLSTVASGNLGVIYATSTLNGTAYNYTLTTSSPTVLSVSQAVFTNGTNPGDILGSKIITGSANLPLALPVLYAIGSNPAIGGLTTGTTYYVVPLGGTTFSLAKYSTSAVAGLSSDYATVTSTNSGTTAHAYTIAPLAWSGNATFIWQASNDNANWATAPSTGTVTFSSSSANLNSLVDFGVFNFRYLRFNYTAPTSGAANIVVPVSIKQDGIGRF